MKKNNLTEEKEEKSRIRIKIKGFDHRLIDQSTRQIIETAEKTGAKVLGPIPLPTGIHRFTVARSTFKHKKAKDQFDMKIHKRLIDLEDYGTSTVESLVNLNLPSGVDLEIKM